MQRKRALLKPDSEWLDAELIRRGWSPEELSAHTGQKLVGGKSKAGVSVQAIRNALRGAASKAETMRGIARGFDVLLGQVVDRSSWHLLRPEELPEGNSETPPAVPQAVEAAPSITDAADQSKHPFRTKVLVGAMVFITSGLIGIAILIYRIRSGSDEGVEVYVNSFEDSEKCRFELLDPDPSETGCRNGVFFVRKDKGHRGLPGSVSLGSFPRDFDLQLKLRVSNATFFVGFRRAVAPGTRMQLQLNMRPDGFWALERETIRGPLKNLVAIGSSLDGYTHADSTQLIGPEWHTLRVWARGSDVYLYLNGKQFAKRCTDEYKPSGGIRPTSTPILIGIYEDQAGREALLVVCHGSIVG